MNEFAERIERDFPVRRKEKEKVDFRTWLVYTLKELGYSPKLESGTSALSAGGNVTNVVSEVQGYEGYREGTDRRLSEVEERTA